MTALVSAIAAPIARSSPRRRGERRWVHRVPCRVEVFGDSDVPAQAIVGETVNISSSGLAVHLGRSLPAGTRVEALVPSLDGKTLRVLGAVIHSRRVLTGTFEVGISRTIA